MEEIDSKTERWMELAEFYMLKPLMINGPNECWNDYPFHHLIHDLQTPVIAGGASLLVSVVAPETLIATHLLACRYFQDFWILQAANKATTYFVP